jgi:hypothetical protein
LDFELERIGVPALGFVQLGGQLLEAPKEAIILRLEQERHLA